MPSATLYGRHLPHGEDHLSWIPAPARLREDGWLPAVAVQHHEKFKPLLAYLRTDAKGAHGIDDTATEYVSVGAWYNFTDNFNAYVDYKINLVGRSGFHRARTGLNKSTDDIVAVAPVQLLSRPDAPYILDRPMVDLLLLATALDDKMGTPGSAMALCGR